MSRGSRTRLAEAGIAAPLLLMKSNGGVAGAAAIRRAARRRPRCPAPPPAWSARAPSAAAAGFAGPHHRRYRRHLRRHLPDQAGGPHRADPAGPRRRLAAAAADGRHGDDRRRRRLARARRPGGALTVGPAQRRRRSRPRLLRPRRHGADGHRRASRARPPAARACSAGACALDPALARARRARRMSPTPLGLDLEDAARGILAIADNNMVGAIRVVSVERGHDPRDFALVPFGGAGPLHGGALARAARHHARVLVPPAPGVLCAQGLLAADLKAEFSRTLPQPLAGADPAALEAAFAELEDEAAAWFAAGGGGPSGPRHAPRGADALRRAGLRAAGALRPRAGRARPRASPPRIAALYGFDLPNTPSRSSRCASRPPAACPPRRRCPPPAAARDRGRVIGRQRMAPARRHGGGAGRSTARASAPARCWRGPRSSCSSTRRRWSPPGWRATMHPSGSLVLRRH